MADNSSLQDDELYLPRMESPIVLHVRLFVDDPDQRRLDTLSFHAKIACAKEQRNAISKVKKVRAVVNKLIKEIVPNIRVSTDARDLLLNCCTEFIHLLASEASSISEKQQKKVISPEHVVEALTVLGFQEYVPDVKAVHKEYKEQASKHRKRGKSKLDKLGIPEEELARQQQQLFDEARQQELESEMEHHKSQSMQPSPAIEETGVLSSNGGPQGTLTDAEKRVFSDTPAVPSTECTSDAKVVPKQEVTDAAQPSSLIKNAAITVASLQATSNLLQQAIAMASAQMAATGNPQIQPRQGEATPQSLLLKQPGLQAAIAAQMAAHKQPRAPVPQLPPGAANQTPTPSTSADNVPAASSSPAPTKELSVAQMMMTLAEASNKNAGNSQISSINTFPPNN